jgi:hypothetical protein
MSTTTPPTADAYVWIPEAGETWDMRHVCRVRLPQKPTEIWTMLGTYAHTKMPPKGVALKHLDTAFHESAIHDWAWKDDTKELVYLSRISMGGVWIAVIY